MAIASVEELVRKHTGSEDQTVTKYARVFHVSATVAELAIAEAIHAPGIPAQGDPHPGDAAAVVRSVGATQISDDPLELEVKVEYSTAIVGGEYTLDPLSREPVYDWSFLHTTEDANRTILGAAIVNSSIELFDPAAGRDISRPMLRVTRNESDGTASSPPPSGGQQNAYTLATSLRYMDTINGAAWPSSAHPIWGQVPKWTAKIADIRATQQKEKWGGLDWTYWSVTYEIHFRWDYWQLRLLDQGYTHLVQSEGIGNGWFQEEIKDFTGSSLSEPRLLDGEGYQILLDNLKQLTQGPFYVPDSANLNINTVPLPDPEANAAAYYAIYREENFDALQLFT